MANQTTVADSAMACQTQKAIKATAATAPACNSGLLAGKIRPASNKAIATNGSMVMSGFISDAPKDFRKPPATKLNTMNPPPSSTIKPPKIQRSVFTMAEG